MRLSVVFLDRSITIDHVGVVFEDDRVEVFDNLVSELGHSNCWAIQWDTDKGHIEYNDGTENESITDVNIITPYINLHESEEEIYIKIVEEKYKQELMSQDPIFLAKEKRAKQFVKYGWMIERSMSGGTFLTQEWKDYFQALRDLPENTENWNPSLQWNEETKNVDVIGVNWPDHPTT
jgi:hypothetical protein